MLALAKRLLFSSGVVLRQKAERGFINASFFVDEDWRTRRGTRAISARREKTFLDLSLYAAHSNNSHSKQQTDDDVSETEQITG